MQRNTMEVLKTSEGQNHVFPTILILVVRCIQWCSTRQVPYRLLAAVRSSSVELLRLIVKLHPLEQTLICHEMALHAAQCCPTYQAGEVE